MKVETSFFRDWRLLGTCCRVTVTAACFGIFILVVIKGSLSLALTCVELEGINIGCVSSIDHTCSRNVAQDEVKPCNYGGGFGTHYRVEGPIAFNCKSSQNTTTCRDECNPDGCTRRCQTTSECLEYFAPTCREECVGCYNNVVTHMAGLTRGCLICTRDRCPDEPLNSYCPNWYNGLMRTNLPLCTASSRCPETAIDPRGQQHPVRVSTGSCPSEPSPLPENNPPTNFPYCPWKEDRRSLTGCEPIDADNRNP